MWPEPNLAETMAAHLSLTTDDGVVLEGRWDRPETEVGSAVVFCHPHPRFRGTMFAPLMNGVTDHLVARGLAVLRFNFRGTGQSGGEHSGGSAEVNDVDAALGEALRRYDTVFLAGWSFGAAMGLRWSALSGSPIPYAGIAPAVHYLPSPGSLPAAPRRIIVGERDQVIDNGQLREFAYATGADVVEMKGSDHFFYFREQRVGDLIADFFFDLTR